MICGSPPVSAAANAPGGIFRVSATGASKEDALQGATQAISHVCSSGRYVIVNDWIMQSVDGSRYSGPVTAYCTT